MNWTPEQVEARFVHYHRTLKMLPDRERAWLYGTRTFWPEVRHTDIEKFAARFEQVKDKMDLDETLVRYVASTDDIRLLWETFNWIPKEEDRRIVSGVTIFKLKRTQIDWSFVRHFSQIFLSRQTMDSRYRTAIDRVVGNLNTQHHEIRACSSC